ncbi:hypothetical protein Shyhy01_39350 [Streptomyces hygroscopicus subsp. hygroscopicus]|nr:hypothetical protein Shyhy01_39350 [Streptomyces hygroscopicus subsp. hygroscopicus]
MQQVDAHVRIAEVDREQVGVCGARGRVDVELPVGDARHDGPARRHGTGRRRPREGRAGQYAERRDNRENRSARCRTPATSGHRAP